MNHHSLKKGNGTSDFETEEDKGRKCMLNKVCHYISKSSGDKSCLLKTNSLLLEKDIFTNGNFLYKRGNLYSIFRQSGENKRLFIPLLVLSYL
jgi:hypothetical protein